MEGFVPVASVDINQLQKDGLRVAEARKAFRKAKSGYIHGRQHRGRSLESKVPVERIVRMAAYHDTSPSVNAGPALS